MRCKSFPFRVSWKPHNDQLSATWPFDLSTLVLSKWRFNEEQNIIWPFNPNEEQNINLYGPKDRDLILSVF